jgi:hypothetical protein
MQTLKPWNKLKKTQEDEMISHVHGLAEYHEKAILQKATYRVNAMPITFQCHSLTFWNRKINPKIHVET